jgi:iron-sulfur cluster assembly accessory protein
MRVSRQNERYECHKVGPGTVEAVRYHEPVTTIEPLVDNPGGTLLALTPVAAAKVRELLAEEGDETLVLRVAIQGGGCSGFQYGLGFDTVAEGDVQLDLEGVPVVVDPFSAPYLRGTTIDFLNSIEESGFKIDNPNATASCGCGHSFTVAEGEEPADDAAAAGCGSGCSH